MRKKKQIKSEDLKYQIGGKEVSESIFYKAIAKEIKEVNKKIKHSPKQ